MIVKNNKILSKKTTFTTVEKRTVAIVFADPLFPKDKLTYNKTLTIKDCVLKTCLNVRDFLDQVYSKKIGQSWKCMNSDDRGYLNKKEHKISVDEAKARKTLVESRIATVNQTAQEVEKMIIKLLYLK
jgi:hypothetical protein